MPLNNSAVTWQTTPHLVLHTEGGNHYLPLMGKTYWTLGRNEDNTFVVKDRWISRNHAMLQRMENGDFFLIDLGSRNGSFVNGRRVTIPVTLHNGDHIVFGQTELEFYCPDITQETDPLEPESEDFTATLTVRRLISVMVMDIRDFTVLTRQLDERILSEVIGRWFRHAGHIIRENGSWVDKYIGDAIMAVWFHGTQGVMHQEILKIAKALSDLHKITMELSHLYPLPFPLRVGAGINTGYAMVGNTGSGGSADYTALGDTVNAAFRLESATKEIGSDIALGETTYQYLAQACPQHRFKQYMVHLKGYDSPTITYGGTFANLDEILDVKLDE
ncbi:FHA domain-containing protein [Planktothrix sp.]|uniref:FHA domain-containing protein n=1 Tax=Planktothrix sp. TaxID=3088171 RepID=UPI0038D3FD9B